MTLAKISAEVFAFVATVYVSRKIGVSNYGKIGFVTSIIIYFDMLSNLGLLTYSIREVSRNQRKLVFFVQHTISLRLVASFVMFTLLMILNGLWGKSFEIKVLLALYALNLFIKSFSIQWSFAAQNRMGLYGFAQVVLQATYMVAILILVRSRDDLFFVPVAMIIGNIAQVLYTWLFQWKNIGRFKLAVNPGIWKGMLKISLPIILSYLIARIYFNFSIIFLGFMGNEEEVGLFMAGFKFIVLLISIREVMVSVAFPLLSRYFVESREKLIKLMRGFIKLAIMFALPVMAGGIVLSRELIGAVFGDEYLGAYLPLRILLVSYFILMLNILYPSAQNAFDRQNIYFKISLINSVFNIVFNLVFIYAFGLIGAALATTFTDLVSLILFQRATYKVVKVGFWEPLFRTLPPTLFMVLVLLALPSHLYVFIKIPIGILVYFIGVFLFRTLTPEEMNVLRELQLRKA